MAELLDNAFLLAYKDDPRFIAFAQKIGVMQKTAPSHDAESGEAIDSKFEIGHVLFLDIVGELEVAHQQTNPRNFFAELKRRNIYKGCCRLRRLLAGLTENQISGNLAFYENNP